MKCIVLFGAGKSATVLIDYLKQLANEKKWHVIVADTNLKTAKEKTQPPVGKSSAGKH